MRIQNVKDWVHRVLSELPPGHRPAPGRRVAILRSVFSALVVWGAMEPSDAKQRSPGSMTTSKRLSKNP